MKEIVFESVDLNSARSYIENLDLSYIVRDMCDELYPLPKWTHLDAVACSRLYKNFLLLKRKHMEVNLVPTREIDEFWHNHILYTKKYTQDCLKIFGHYLHHEPASPADNPEKLINEFLITKKLYLEEFKISL